MRETTTIRVSTDTRAGLRELAEHDGVTMDDEIARLVRAERQRRIGAALAASMHDRDDEQWLTMSARTVTDDAGG